MGRLSHLVDMMRWWWVASLVFQPDECACGQGSEQLDQPEDEEELPEKATHGLTGRSADSPAGTLFECRSAHQARATVCDGYWRDERRYCGQSD